MAIAPEKADLMRQIWLTYLNQTAFAQGLITEQQRNQLTLHITQSKRPPK